jgi:hypothetical protein
MGAEVVIQMLRGDVPVGKQTQQCLEFCINQGWRVKAMVPAGGMEQTVHLVQDGQAELVLMPFVNRESLEIEERVAAAGGKVAYCRQRPADRSQQDVDTSGVINFLYQRGRPVGEIAPFLRTSKDRVIRALRRQGITKPKE